MRIILVALLGAVLFACGEQTEVIIGERTTLKVDTRVFDAGEVLKGEVIEAKFVVENTGEVPLSIADVSTSCSCTVGDYPKDPIPPGKTGIVTASVDTDRVSGARVDKAITILANTKPSKTELKIKGTIINK